MSALLSSLRQLVEFSRTGYRTCAVFLMQDRDAQRVYRLYDFTRTQLMPPDGANCIAGTVNSSDELHLTIESVRPDTKHFRDSNARRKKDGKRVRKAVLREMKKLSKIIAAHAGRHREALEKRWQETDLKQGEARQIVERIIGERQVKNDEKILSLYQGHAAVYVRGKAGAEVEFGSQLLLGESQSGVIVDWELVGGNPRADTKMPRRSLERMKDGKFVDLQKRRSQTEARISIFKNGFLGSPLLSKGRADQEREVAWNVLTHNLWVMARLPRAKARPKALARAS